MKFFLLLTLRLPLKYTAVIPAFALILQSANAQAQTGPASLAIQTAPVEIVGLTSEIPVGTIGTRDNTDTWNFNSFARFVMAGEDASGLPVTVGMEVRPVAVSGDLLVDTDSLMIARASKNQDLQDPGSLAVYVSPDTRGAWRLDLEFKFYTPDFLTPLITPINLTAMDLDSSQRLVFLDNEISSYTLETGSRVFPAKRANGTTVFTGVGSGRTNDSKSSLLAAMRAATGFRISLEHQDVALYLFEFRNPSVNTAYSKPVHYSILPPVPELSISLSRSVSWQSRLGFDYLLQASPNLTAWTNVGDFVPGTGLVMTLETPVQEDRAFYRLQVRSTP